MAGWDEGGVYFSDRIATVTENVDEVRGNAAKAFFDFIRNFREGNTFVYRYGRELRGSVWHVTLILTPLGGT